MKRLFFSIVILCSCLLGQAQTITTQSSCDSNGDGKVDVTDVTNTANKVIAKAATENNVVTAEQLNASFNAILEKLTSIESRLNAIEEKLGMNSTVTYYYGEIDASKSVFSTMSFADLNPTPATCNKDCATGDKVVNATHMIFFVLVPVTGATLTKFKYTSDGYDSDILGNDAFNCTHDNITYNGVEYIVYAYRQATTTATDPLKWTYTIQF